MTQKEALTNILTSIDHPALRRIFVCRWLEDINWHGECARLWDALPDVQRQQIDRMEEAIKSGADHLPGGLPLPFQPYDFKNANERLLPGFVYAFGWGIDPADWQSDGQGALFVDELEAMIQQPEPVRAQRAA
jgi:hypothetical protein